MTHQWTEAGLARLMNDVKKENGMDNDRELLELAAKAAGMAIEWDAMYSRFTGQFECFRLPNGRAWNPLTDDGDALRLADKLGLNIERYDGNATVVGNLDMDEWPHEPDGDDRGAATRRAIVRAAAEIGRTKP